MVHLFREPRQDVEAGHERARGARPRKHEAAVVVAAVAHARRVRRGHRQLHVGPDRGRRYRRQHATRSRRVAARGSRRRPARDRADLRRRQRRVVLVRARGCRRTTAACASSRLRVRSTIARDAPARTSGREGRDSAGVVATRAACVEDPFDVLVVGRLGRFDRRRSGHPRCQRRGCPGHCHSGGHEQENEAQPHRLILPPSQVTHSDLIFMR